MAFPFLTSFPPIQEGSHHRSTVLKTPSWLAATFTTGIIFSISLYVHYVVWISILFSILLILIFLIMSYMIIYFVHKDPDALRSEGYILRKKEIEKGPFGDNDQGETNNNTDKFTKSKRDDAKPTREQHQ